MSFDEFKKRHQKISVQEYPNEVSENPVVSVCVQTYNHALYIKDCLEGILRQKTDFSFEILLGEDASSDGTREVCLKYARRFPKRIRLFLHHRENNIYINGYPSGRFNILYNLFCVRGRYIAICEGDDYWTDPLKLQKQVEFLEANPDYSLVVGGFREIHAFTREEQVIVQIPNGVELEDGMGYSFTLETTMNGWITKTLTATFRNDRQVIRKLSIYKYGRDVNLFYHMLKTGKGFYFTQILGVYTVHKGGIFSLNDRGVNLRNAYCIYKELHLVNQDEFTRFKRLNSTVDLLNYNLYRFSGRNLKGTSTLFSEIFGLIVKPKDLLQLILLLPPPRVRGKIKPWFI